MMRRLLPDFAGRTIAALGGGARSNSRHHRCGRTRGGRASRDDARLGALFAALAVGFWLGPKKLGGFSLGNVTATLLAAIAIGQLGIQVPGPSGGTDTNDGSPPARLARVSSDRLLLDRSRPMIGKATTFAA